MATILVLLLILVVVGGGIGVWIMVQNGKQPEVTRKWTDPKTRD